MYGTSQVHYIYSGTIVTLWGKVYIYDVEGVGPYIIYTIIRPSDDLFLPVPSWICLPLLSSQDVSSAVYNYAD